MWSGKVIAAVLVVFVVGIALGALVTSGSKSGNAVTVLSMETTTLRLTTISITTVTVTNLREGAVLVNYSGSGDANSPPFTATSSTANVTLEISSGTPSYSAVAWYLYPTNSSLYTSTGEANGKVGTFDFYAYGLVPGATYYLSVLSANADWQAVVNTVT